MIADAVDASQRVLLACLLWAGAIGAACALVVLVVLAAGVLLGTWASRGARTVWRWTAARRDTTTPPDAPHTLDGTPEPPETRTPADSRTRPAWSRT